MIIEDIKKLKAGDIIYGIYNEGGGYTFSKGNVYKIIEIVSNGEQYDCKTIVLEMEPYSPALCIGHPYRIVLKSRSFQHWEVKKPNITKFGKFINDIYLKEKSKRCDL